MSTAGGPQIVGDVWLHATAFVHPTAKLGPNVSLGPGVHVGAGARVRDAIILTGVTLGVRAVSSPCIDL